MNGLLDYNIDELKDLLAGMGEKPFRAGQIMKWLSMGKPFDLRLYFRALVCRTNVPDAYKKVPV